MAVCDFNEVTTADEQAASPTTGNGQPLLLPEGVPPLRSFYLYMSNSCNLKCRHCWITPKFVNGKASPGDVIDVEALRDAVSEAKLLGLRNVKLTGGEPMLHPRFMEIVDMLTAEGLGMNVETNGTLLTAGVARYLKEETNVSFVSVSIDGADANTHDPFRGVPGSFETVLRGLGYLVEAGYTNTQVIMSVHRGNLGQIEDVVQLASGRGAASVKFNPITNDGRGEKMHDRGETLDFDGILTLADYVRGELQERVPIRLVLNIPPALTPIPVLWRTRGTTGDCGVSSILGMLGTGEIALCGIGRTIPELVYGRLGEDSIRKLWLTHPMILELRRALDDVRNYPDICGQCIHAKTCRTGCVANHYVDDRRLVWPGTLCVEAARRGKFPATRLRSK
ncbi:MAG: radical SAM protein [Anaerolineales bacterium]